MVYLPPQPLVSRRWGLTATSGTTVITNSDMRSLDASGTANITVTGGTVIDNVATTTPTGFNNPSITLTSTVVPGLNAAAGSISMTGGTVLGGVSATGSSTISVTSSTVMAAPTLEIATLNLSNSTIKNIDASGDDSHSTVNVTGGEVLVVCRRAVTRP